MDIRKTIKKMSALATGAAMLGATVMGAVAYDLGDYPHPYVDEDGAFSGYLVVGTNGNNAAGIAQDMLGVADIAASLQAAAKTPVSVSGGSVTVEGGKDYDELELNTKWDSVTLTDSKLSGFKDTQADFNGEDVDYHDELTLGANASTFITSRIEKDFGDEIYMTVTADSIKYKVKFDDHFDETTVGTGDGKDELEFYFLGKLLKVTNVATDGKSMTVEASSEHFLEQGDSLTIDGKKITLVRVGESSAIVEVDGQREIISKGDKETFDAAGDFEVKVKGIFFAEGASDNGASLELGKDLTESAKDGKSAELFGEPKDKDDAEWHWEINLNATSQYVGLTNHIGRDDLNCDESDERCALKVGESIDLPNNYASMQFYALEEPEYATISVTVKDDGISVEDSDDKESDDVAGVIFETNTGNDDFRVGSADTSKVWVLYNGDIWYEDGDDEVNATAATSFQIKIDDDYATVTPPASPTTDLSAGHLNDSADWSMVFTSNSVNVDSLHFFVDVDNDYFGAKDDEEADELKYSPTAAYSGAKDIGTKDYDYVTDYGVIIKKPESQFGSGSNFEIMVPTNQQKATLLVTSKASVVAASSGNSGAYKLNKIQAPIAILDSEAESMVGDSNLIVVGGPYVNSVAAELMGNPTNEQIAKMFEPGKAKIKLWADKNAILVAGYSADDTTGAARVLARYDDADYALSGDEVEVLVPSTGEMTVRDTPTLPSTADAVAKMASEDKEPQDAE